jgi:hypothetical protein
MSLTQEGKISARIIQVWEFIIAGEFYQLSNETSYRSSWCRDALVTMVTELFSPLGRYNLSHSIGFKV